MDDDIRQLILKNVDSSTIKKTAVQQGDAHPARRRRRARSCAGETTIAEVLSVTQEDI